MPQEGLGGRLWGGTLYELAPGERSSDYHWHYGEEEILVVLRGAVVVRTPQGDRELGPWDSAWFVTGERGAHGVRNDGDEPARFVMFSTLSDPEVTVYPIGARRSRSPGGAAPTFRSCEAALNLRDAALGARDAAAGFEHSAVSVRETLGGDRIGCTLYEIPSGMQLWPYHFHWNNEEWLLVVDGAPRLRTPDGERELRPGDLVTFPEGGAGAHTLFGPGRVAIFSTRNEGSCMYPDSGKVGAGPPWDRLYFNRDDAVDYWEGE